MNELSALSPNMGEYMLVCIVAMSVCMALIPLTMRSAPLLGMVDEPDARKVHRQVIPRVGGIGIVIGMLVPLLIWLPMDEFVVSVITGCLVLLLFGAVDDAHELGPMVKFAGQFMAALIVVYVGGVYIDRIPFLYTYELPAVLGMPLTVIAIVGMINALNLSDGLDGLAGGEALLSLCAILYLSFIFEGDIALFICAACVGGIFGFLRFNSHPAKVFMGDSGSQTLGFILGVLVVYQMQTVNAVTSAALPLLLLGLPVIDAMVVFYLRARRGDSLVVAARDHLHHRLLDMGFQHYESVIIIYSAQLLLVICGAVFPYHDDGFLLGIYLLISVSLFSLVYLAERIGWKVRDDECSEAAAAAPESGFVQALKRLMKLVLCAGLSSYIIFASFMVEYVPVDIGVGSGLLLLCIAIALYLRQQQMLLYKVTIYMTTAFSVYLMVEYQPALLAELDIVVAAFFILLAVVWAASVKLGEHDTFEITPLDYLVIVAVILIGLSPEVEVGGTSIIWMAIEIIMLFYVAEYCIQAIGTAWNYMTSAVSIALAVQVVRALTNF